MLPKIFPILNTTAIKALVGTNPVRIYRHGQAPEGVVRPYITWFVVIGTPYDQVSGVPCGDNDTVQIDVWSESDSQVETLASLVRDAIESAGYTCRISTNDFETETKLYRIGFDVDFIHSR